MKFLLPVLFFTLAWTVAHAETLKSRVHSVVKSEDGLRPHLLLMENGLVVKLRAEEKSLEAFANLSSNEVVIHYDEGRYLQSVSLLEKQSQLETVSDKLLPEKPIRYTPTNLSSMAEAEAIFKRQNRDYQRASQCYNRAHVWAYEEFKRSGLQSMKLFLFFTKRYIWDYDYEWWFHVAPMTYVNGEAVTLDKMFMKGPVSVKDWTLKFIYSKRDCPIIKKYADYENNQETQHCYLIPTSMFYWQPYDIDQFDRTGYEKTEFIKKQVNWAYWEAF